MITSIRNVRQVAAGEYICTITLNGEDMEFYAKPGGGGYCNFVLTAIANGQHEGQITPYVTPAPTQANLLAALADRRYAVETGGTTINSVPIQTDRESRANLIAARIIAKEDAGYNTTWKTSAGFVNLTAAQIIAVADAVAEFVKRCFEAEAAVAAVIGEFTTTQQVVAAFDAEMAG